MAHFEAHVNLIPWEVYDELHIINLILWTSYFGPHIVNPILGTSWWNHSSCVYQDDAPSMNRRERLLFINQSDQSKLIENSFKFQMFIIQMSAPKRRSAIQGSPGRDSEMESFHWWRKFSFGNAFFLSNLLVFYRPEKRPNAFHRIVRHNRLLGAKSEGKGSEGQWRVGRPMESGKTVGGSEGR